MDPKTPKWIAAIVVTAVVAVGATWFVTDRDEPDRTGEPVAAESEHAPTTADPADDASASWLFAVNAAGGTFVPGVDGAAGTLTLDRVEASTTGFTDRPVRDAVVFATDELPQAWPTLFGDSDPNAVLTTRSADGTSATFVLTLSDPVADGSTLRFTATSVVGRDHSSQLPGMTAAPSTPPPSTFSDASLFIDDASTTSLFVCVSLQEDSVVNPPGQIPTTDDSTDFAAECHQNGGHVRIVS